MMITARGKARVHASASQNTATALAEQKAEEKRLATEDARLATQINSTSTKRDDLVRMGRTKDATAAADEIRTLENKRLELRRQQRANEQKVAAAKKVEASAEAESVEAVAKARAAQLKIKDNATPQPRPVTPKPSTPAPSTAPKAAPAPTAQATPAPAPTKVAPPAAAEATATRAPRQTRPRTAAVEPTVADTEAGRVPRSSRRSAANATSLRGAFESLEQTIAGSMDDLGKRFEAAIAESTARMPHLDTELKALRSQFTQQSAGLGNNPDPRRVEELQRKMVEELKKLNEHNADENRGILA